MWEMSGASRVSGIKTEIKLFELFFILGFCFSISCFAQYKLPLAHQDTAIVEIWKASRESIF